ncbi:MAG TPA: hypothetical protein VF121_05275 [Thermoanaerobaculia bacterium]|nr:hypothetical protein [Thermoanaerobaculia bacterium]
MLPQRRVAALAPLLLAAAAAAAQPTPPPQGQADPRAAEVAERLLTALGGREAWEATRYIRFNFNGRRTHVWDKHTGRHRVEGQTQEGKSFLVLHNVATREGGQAWLDGRPASAEEAPELLERAYGAWINDTYWLLMPYKLRDPGASLAFDGEETLDGQVYDKLRLSFQAVGLTPGDTYWAYVNRATGLMDRWAYRLQDQPPDAAPTVWLWQGWDTFGRIKLAPLRVQLGAERRLELRDIAVADTLPDTVFSSPEPAPSP